VLEPFEAGDRRHQYNILLPDSRRSFKVSKPIAHATTHKDTQHKTRNRIMTGQGDLCAGHAKRASGGLKTPACEGDRPDPAFMKQ
jgi:hypothetical protein